MTARLANSCSVVAVDVFMVLALATPAQARSVMATVVLILFICNVLLHWLANPRRSASELVHGARSV